MDRNQVAKELIDRASDLYEVGKFDEATRLVEEAMAQDPEWPMRGHALHAQAILLGETGQLEKAEQAWSVFLDEAAQHPDFDGAKLAQANHNYGFTLRMLGRYKEACDRYEIAADLHKRLGNNRYRLWAIHNMAWAACLGGCDELSHEVLAEAAKLVTDAEGRYNQLVGEAFAHEVCGDPDRALVMAEPVAGDEAAPNYVRVQAYWVTGNAYLQKGNVLAAANVARIAAAMAKGDPSEFRLMLDIRSLEAKIAKAG